MSSLTNSDYISIVTTFMVMTDNNLKCSMCKNKHRGSTKRQELLFKQKGCKEVSTNPKTQYKPTHEMTGASPILYYTCPANLRDGSASSLISVYDNYDKGIMPFSGGLLEQPSKFVEVMDLVHNLTSEYQTQRNKDLAKRRR